MPKIVLSIAGKAALNMRVAKECQLNRRLFEQRVSITRHQHIFIFIAGRAVDTFHVGQWRDWTMRKLLQEFQIFRRQSLLGPERSQSGNGIESIKISKAGTCFVMVAADEHLA